MDAGAVQPRVTLLVPGCAELSVGALGAVAGIAESAFEGRLVPTAFVAVTVNE